MKLPKIRWPCLQEHSNGETRLLSSGSKDGISAVVNWVAKGIYQKLEGPLNLHSLVCLKSLGQPTSYLRPSLYLCNRG